MLDKFQRAFDNLKKIADGRNKRIEGLATELEEYGKRHPSTVKVKNKKPYEIDEVSKLVQGTHCQGFCGPFRNCRA